MIPLISVFDQMSIISECIVLYFLGVFFGCLLTWWMMREVVPEIKRRKNAKAKHYAGEDEDDE